MTVLRTDPDFIDINIATSIDFQANLTDYVDLLGDFADECAVSSIYKHTDNHSDPITSKINFYKSLNSGSLKLKDNADGVKKRDVDSKQLINKNYRDQLPPNKHLKTTSGNKYGTPKLIGTSKVETYSETTTRKWIGTGDNPENSQSVGEWKIEQRREDSTHDVTPVLDIQNSPPELQQQFGMSDMTARYKLWWMERFNTAHDTLKKDLVELLGDENEYFVRFSESVGQLKNLDDTYDCDTLPVWDTQVSAYGDQYSTPNTLPGVARYCMVPEQQAFCTNLSKHTNIQFRTNLGNLMEDASRDEIITGVMPGFSVMSHGNNLVTDSEHYTRMTQNAETVQDVLRAHLRGLYDVLDLLSNRENYMVVGKPKQIHIKVEQFTCAVDLLKNRIKSFDLTKCDVTNTRYGKRVTYNNLTTNAEKLAVPGTKES